MTSTSLLYDAVSDMGRRRSWDHVDDLKLDMLIAQVIKHPRATTEKHWHKMNPNIIDQPRFEILLPDIRPTHYGDVFVPLWAHHV
jgi:hypothetical protein